MTIIQIEIDCNNDTCGNCRLRARTVYYCDAFKQELGIKITKEPRYKLEYRRCPQCLESEVKHD